MHAVPHGTCAERAPLLLQITELAIEADLPRASVLAWLRQLEKAPEECVPALLSPPLSRCSLPSLTGAELTAWLPAQGAGARADRKAGGGARRGGARARARRSSARPWRRGACRAAGGGRAWRRRALAHRPRRTVRGRCGALSLPPALMNQLLSIASPH